MVKPEGMTGEHVHVLRGIGAWRAEKSPAVVAVGTFDGVHLGHKALIRRTIERARATGRRAVVVTFEPHPRERFGSGQAERLSTPAEKLAQLRDLEPDAIVVLDFSGELPDMPAADFASTMLSSAIGAAEVHVGFNFHFGNDGAGTVDDLRRWGAELGFVCSVLAPIEYEHEPISSSRIRAALRQGAVGLARFLIGRPYELVGTVVRGEGRGRDLGFPTANVAIDDERKLLPRFGVYVGATAGQPCLVSIGLSPTFGPRQDPRIEVYVPGVSEELYEQAMAVELIEWIRPEFQFSSPAELVAQMEDDLHYLVQVTGRRNEKCRSSLQECKSP